MYTGPQNYLKTLRSVIKVYNPALWSRPIRDCIYSLHCQLYGLKSLKLGNREPSYAPSCSGCVETLFLYSLMSEGDLNYTTQELFSQAHLSFIKPNWPESVLSLFIDNEWPSSFFIWLHNITSYLFILHWDVPYWEEYSFLSVHRAHTGSDRFPRIRQLFWHLLARAEIMFKFVPGHSFVTL